MKCAVRGCKNEAYNLLLWIRLDTEEEVGNWAGDWFCDKHMLQLAEQTRVRKVFPKKYGAKTK